MTKDLYQNKNHDKWIEDYKEIRAKYEEFCKKLEDLFEGLLKGKSIDYHAIERRTKSVGSFSKKINRVGITYEDPLTEITDLAGIRIIVYYQDDVDKVCALIDNEFIVDVSKSVDKKSILKVDQFGYLSVHKIITLKDDRAKLPEWSEFKNLVAEVQVRTVLQHAWASISHKIQYKRENEIPDEIRRKLICLSGLLELADGQFKVIRKEQNDMQQKTFKKIKGKDFDMDINLMTLKEFITTSKICEEISKIAFESGFVNTSISEGKIFEATSLSELFTACSMTGLVKISELNNKLIDLKPMLSSFFSNCIKYILQLMLNIEGFINNEFKCAGDIANFLTMIIVGSSQAILDAKYLDWKTSISWEKNYITAVCAAAIESNLT